MIKDYFNLNRCKKVPMILEFIPIVGLFFTEINNGGNIVGDKKKDKIELVVIMYHVLCLVLILIFLIGLLGYLKTKICV